VLSGKYEYLRRRAQLDSYHYRHRMHMTPPGI
jgi:hypothetical protein